MLFFKSIGSLLFSIVLLNVYGSGIHNDFIHDLSLILGASVFSKLGVEQVIYKYGGKLYSEKSFELFGGLISKLILIISLSTIFVYLLLKLCIDFKIFTDVGAFVSLLCINLAAVFATLLIVVEKQQYSYFLENGFVLLIVSIFLLLFNNYFTEVEKLIPTFWFIAISIFFAVLFIYKVKRNLVLTSYSYKNFSKEIPYFTTNNFFTYFVNWGILLWITTLYEGDDAAQLILAIRVTLIFSLAMIPISSIFVPKMHYIFSKHGKEQLADFIKDYTSIFKLISIFVTIVGGGSFYVVNQFVNVFNMTLSLNIFVPLLLSAAYHLATGPATICLNMLGAEKAVINIKAGSTLLLMCVIVFELDPSNFALVFSIYIILQKALLIHYLKSNFQLNFKLFG